MSEIAALKARARDAAKARRAAAHSDPVAARLATGVLLDFLKPYRGEVIAGYMPMGTELDPLPAMKVLAKTSEIAVPVVEGKAMPLRFDRWAPDTAMMTGAFGASVPEVSEPIVPKVVIVPLLAFSSTGGRLGYGGGFYDRTLEVLRATLRPVAVGFAYSGQQDEELPVEDVDQRLDVIVTENGVIAI